MASSLLYPSLEIQSIYNFSLLAQGILGEGYSGAKLVGILDYYSAVQIQDVTGLHKAAYPSLPAGTPSDPTQLIYLKLITSSAQTVVVAQNWLSAEPVLVQGTTATIVVSNIATADITKLRNILAANGYNSFQITST